MTTDQIENRFNARKLFFKLKDYIRENGMPSDKPEDDPIINSYINEIESFNCKVRFVENHGVWSMKLCINNFNEVLEETPLPRPKDETKILLKDLIRLLPSAFTIQIRRAFGDGNYYEGLIHEIPKNFKYWNHEVIFVYGSSKRAVGDTPRLSKEEPIEMLDIAIGDFDHGSLNQRKILSGQTIYLHKC